MVCLAPRALGNCAPSAPAGVGARPLNFTVRRPHSRGVSWPNLKHSAAATAVTFATPYRGRPSNHWCAIAPIAGALQELNRWGGSSCAPNNSR